MFANRLSGLLSLLIVVAAVSTAQAQWIRKPSDLDPTNKNSAVRKTGRKANDVVLGEIEGTRYRVTIRNPTANRVAFRINGAPYFLGDHQRITITGRGTPEITFDYGLGNGSFKSYRLYSGKTYLFQWKRASLGSPYDGIRSLLELYLD